MARVNGKGQVTLPRRIREALGLMPGTAVEFAVNALGEVVLRPSRPGSDARASSAHERFDAVRGRADVPWRTDALMKLLRADD